LMYSIEFSCCPPQNFLWLWAFLAKPSHQLKWGHSWHPLSQGPHSNRPTAAFVSQLSNQKRMPTLWT
jgi:hypothetical protein